MAADLRSEADAALIRDSVEADARAYEFSADMRYYGQAYELVIPWGDVAPSGASLADLVQRFHTEHAARFAHSDEADVVEIVTLRLAAIGRMPDPELADAALASGAPTPPVPSGQRRVWLDEAWVEAAIYQRSDIDAGASLSGPAIIEEAFTTLVVPARWTVKMTPFGDMLAEKN
jgi:N-methylhydantoinase A/oxoprolinase/acetone carboxylase beta subunit